MAVWGSLNVSLRKTTTDDNWHCKESFDLPERQKKKVLELELEQNASAK